MTSKTRLHITPFDESLLSVALPSDTRSQATGVTFHSILTFPEKNYGYVDLPEALAIRLKKRLHGSIIRGKKISVENARPKRRALQDNELARNLHVQVRKPTATTQSQRVKSIRAMELPKERKVKRGWSKPADGAVDGKHKSTRASQKKSNPDKTPSSEDPACLFKTTVPPPKMNLPTDGSSTSKKRKRSGIGQDVVIREFQATKHLPDDQIAGTDSTGTRADRAPIDVDTSSQKQKNVAEKASKRKQRRGSGVGNTAPNVTSVEVLSPRQVEKVSRKGEAPTPSVPARDENDVLSSGQDRGSRHQRHAGKDRPRDDSSDAASRESQEIEPSQVERLSISRSSASPPAQVSPQPTSEPSTAVHPLKALFKRPQTAASQSQTPRKPHLEVSTAFNFFDAEAVGPNQEDATLLMPQTPFTQQDIRNRRQRSAAPTPDTALPGKTFDDILGETASAESHSEGGEEGQVTSGAAGGKAEGQANDMQGADSQESENVKWFYEQRGANRRSWQRERREATKSKKFRERKEKR